jgi:hypothetical protein
MKFQVYEIILNEYVQHPTQRLLGEVEAKSAQEANQVIRLQHPNRGPLVINGQQFDK